MSSSPTDMEPEMEQEMPKAEETPTPAPAQRKLKLKLLVPLIVAVAAIGFGTGHMSVGFMESGPKAQEEAAAPEAHNTGRFAIAVQEPKLTVIEAIVLVEPSTESPQNASQLRDAILGLLTEAAALPLVQQADDGIVMLERSTMAMASETAPWLAGLDLAAATQ
ncbi:MAG: hypothetical protein ACEPO2_11130 [Pelagibaca sp.]